MQKAVDGRAQSSFRTLLMKWNKTKNDRSMPWKGEKDPYRIWLSEIILQQTRVEQGLAYYQRFITKFPDVRSLASAPDASVLKLWEGLGYYSRCRNLLQAARSISNERGGIFPDTYEDIKALKGVGPYTAAAISSFAFNLPHAVVDGNVFRVLARVFAISKPIDSTDGKKYFTTLASELLDKSKPGIYNQAIMDFGATICKPQLPLCATCPMNKICKAYAAGRVQDYPTKGKKLQVRKRWFYYLVLEHRGRIAIRQRTGKDIWNQLYEFPLIETAGEEETEAILNVARKNGWLREGKYKVEDQSPAFRQQLSHQLIMARFIRITLRSPSQAGEWVSPAGLDQFAFPRIVHHYLNRTGAD